MDPKDISYRGRAYDWRAIRMKERNEKRLQESKKQIRLIIEDEDEDLDEFTYVILEHITNHLDDVMEAN